MRRLGCSTWLAVILTLTTAGYGIWVHSLRWEKQADFDILGFMWVLSNIPVLVAWSLFYLFAGFTIAAWILVYKSRGLEDFRE